MVLFSLSSVALFPSSIRTFPLGFLSIQPFSILLLTFPTIHPSALCWIVLIRFCAECITRHLAESEHSACPVCRAYTNGTFDLHARLGEVITRVTAASQMATCTPSPPALQVLNLSSLEELTHHIDGCTLFVFDVDETLMTPR